MKAWALALALCGAASAGSVVNFHSNGLGSNYKAYLSAAVQQVNPNYLNYTDKREARYVKDCGCNITAEADGGFLIFNAVFDRKAYPEGLTLSNEVWPSYFHYYLYWLGEVRRNAATEAWRREGVSASNAVMGLHLIVALRDKAGRGTLYLSGYSQEGQVGFSGEAYLMADGRYERVGYVNDGQLLALDADTDLSGKFTLAARARKIFGLLK